MNDETLKQKMLEKIRLPRPKNADGLDVELEIDGELEIGLLFDDNPIPHKAFTVGPLTVDAETAAECTMPATVDQGLIFRSYFHRTLSKEDRDKFFEKNKDVDPSEIPPVTDEENNIALRMEKIRYRHQCRYRLLRLGSIPTDVLSEAAGKLDKDDMSEIVGVCKEVDKRVDSFRGKNGTALEAKLAARKDGDPAGSVD